MRNYDIYLVEEEVASLYFGKEEMLFQLFLDMKHTNKTPKPILEKQIDFITRSISTIKVNQQIKKEFKNHPNYKFEQLSHKIALPNGQAELKVYEKYLTLSSSGDIETEMLFFEVLRRIDDCYLALEYTNNRYGWLKPRREQAVQLKKRIVVL